jgi:hypothetical protein
MHCAVLTPTRPASWLRAATNRGMPGCQPLLEALELRLTPQRPPFEGMPAAGVRPRDGVSRAEREEGAAQLRREVRYHRVTVTVPVTVTVTVAGSCDSCDHTASGSPAVGGGDCVAAV